jgi:hypothetical protein
MELPCNGEKGLNLIHKFGVIANINDRQRVGIGLSLKGECSLSHTYKCNKWEINNEVAVYF